MTRTICVMRRALFVLIPLLAAGVLGGIAGSAATGLVRVPRVSELETYRPDIITEIRGTRRLDDRALRHRAADPDLARRDPGRRPQRDRRDRGQELLPPRRRGPGRARSRPLVVERAAASATRREARR